MEQRAAADGERKTITALFADIAGSMELMEELDPEEARRVIDPVLQIMMDAVHRYEGYVVQSAGDGIFALFGAPIAHEDHPQRALFAALWMQEESKRYADKLRWEHGVNVQIRVGVNTGEMVVRSIRRGDLQADYTPIGHSTGLAQRMESLATPGTTLVTEHTQRLCEGYFEFKSLGAARVKGVSEPVHVYEVGGVGPLRTRLQRSARRGLVRFVGRQNEMAQMKRAWASALEGQGQIVGVVGEAGLGKSRLCYEFKIVSQSGCLTLEIFSVSHGKASAYLPLIDLLRNYFEIEPHDDERRRREKVTGKTLTLDRSLEDALPYLFALLSIPDPESSLPLMDPHIRRRRTFDAIKRLLLRESLNQPLMIIFEDLHWLDGETEAFLIALSESVATARILLLVNYRPEYQHGWGNKTYYTQLRLDPLREEDADELLGLLLGGDAELQPLKRMILEKTQGNPFFTEEIVQGLFDEGVPVRENVGAELCVRPTRSITEIHVPPTVQGVLAARIDRLGAEEKLLLQTLSVMGKEFSLSLIQRVVEQPEEAMLSQLSRLQAGEFIYEQPAFPDIEYTFKHALTQEVAYNSLLRERRSALHERTARAMEELWHHRLEDHYGELAHHYSRSGNMRKAVDYQGRAGRQSAERSAYAEAVSHMSQGLELLKALPDAPERDRLELALQTILGSALRIVKGFAAAEVERAYARAHELCRQAGETPELFVVLRGLYAFHLWRGHHRTALELGERCLGMAQRMKDPMFLMEAHRSLGQSYYYLGEFTAALSHLEQGIALYDPQQHRSASVLIDAGITCLNFSAWTLWNLGYPDQALNRSLEAMALTQELSHPFSMAATLIGNCISHALRGEIQATQERAEAAIALSTEQGFPLWLGMGTAMRGWALTEQEQADEGIAQMRQGIATWRTTGADMGVPFMLGTLAEACGKVGRTEEGLTLLSEASAMVCKNEEHGTEPWLYVVKGELLLACVGAINCAHTNEAEAEDCFQHALELARRQSAKSLELRAATSLSRLWLRQGKKDEARQRLSEIYGWFTEGFDTADLKEAKALLESMG